MIRAYIFDFFETLGYYTNGDEIKGIVGEEHKNLQLIKLEDSKLSEEKKKKVLELYKPFKVHLYDDTKKVIKQLKKENNKLAILSNCYDLTAQAIRRDLAEFLKYFDCVILSPEIGVMKPDQKIFLYTLEKLNVKPKEVIAIGDNYKVDILPSIELKMHAISIDRKKQTLEEVIKDIKGTIKNGRAN